MSKENSKVTVDRNTMKIGGEVVHVSDTYTVGPYTKCKVTIRCDEVDGKPNYPKVTVSGDDVETVADLKGQEICFAARLNTYTGVNPKTGRPYKKTEIEACEILKIAPVNEDTTLACNEMQVGGEILEISDERSFGEGKEDRTRDALVKSQAEDGTSDTPKLSVNGKLADDVASLEKGDTACFGGRVRTYTYERKGKAFTGMSYEITSILSIGSSSPEDAGSEVEEQPELVAAPEAEGSDS